MSRGPIVFFGTPRFAVPTLEALAAAGRAPALVVSQPSRPAGRGRRVQAPPVAEWARERGIELLQPRRVRRSEFVERLAALAPEVAVVVAFGQIFPPALLELPALGCVNLHASLLPKYRGAAPVQAAVAAGERVTGVTTMLMEEGLDSGPILLQEEVAIGEEETAGELAPRLAAAGGRLMVETLERLEAGTLEPRPQDHAAATWAPLLKKEDGRADWRLEARALYNRLRGYTPWPGLHAELRGEIVKIGAARPLRGTEESPAAPGTLLGLREGRLAVACGGGTALGIEILQRPGRKALPAEVFVRGERLEPGDRFG